MNSRVRAAAIGLALSLTAVLATGCELSAIPRATPTVFTTPSTPTLTATPSELPTQPPAVTPTPPPRLATSTYTPTSSIPTETLVPSATPGPFTYVIQPSDTYFYLMTNPPINYSWAQASGLINEFLRLNPGIRTIDQLPSPGSTIYIPVLPPTPTPAGYDQTQTAQPAVQSISLPENAQIMQVPVQEDVSILGIAQDYATTLSILATLNPQLNFFGCDFANPSGGPDCTVFMVVGDNVNVPAPTPTITLSPTPSGSETPTPTPTHEAPALVFPPQNGVAPARTFQLQWISVGELQADEAYFVEVQDTTAGTQLQDATRGTSYMLPEAMVPTDGQMHSIQWRVTVAMRTPDGSYVVIGAVGNWRQFTWQSR